MSLAAHTSTLPANAVAWNFHNTREHASECMRAVFRSRFKDVMPIPVGVEPATPEIELKRNAVLTLGLPGRGHVQIRVAEVTDGHVVISTLRGHALAGIVRFGARDLENGVRFDVITCDAAANTPDWVMLTLSGARAQDATSTTVVRTSSSSAADTPGASSGTCGNSASARRDTRSDGSTGSSNGSARPRAQRPR
jgi:hypothetical protein